MKGRSRSQILLVSVVAVALVWSPLGVRYSWAQNPEIQQRVAEVKQAAAANKQALAHYQWQEQQSISIKGNVKDTKTFQVRLGPDGKPQKEELTNLPQSSGGRQHGLVHHEKEKKGEEYKEYGQQMAAMAQQYAQPDPERLQAAFQQGNVMMGSGGMPGQAKLIITNYLKPNDKVTLVFDQQAKAIQSVNVQSYLNDPKDAVTIAAQFTRLPDGTNHVSTMQINGVSKDLLITTQNSNYEKAM
jgi:hypothetical protein